MRSSPPSVDNTEKQPLRSLVFAALFASIVLVGLLWQDTRAQTMPGQSTVPPVDFYMPVILNVGTYSVASQKLIGGHLPPMHALASGLPPGSQPNRFKAVYVPALSAGGERNPASVCPLTSHAVFDAIPIEGSPVDRPAPVNPDLNLSLRGYVTSSVELTLVNINGPTDDDAPQLVGITNGTMPTFSAAYQVFDWDWACASGPHGCRSAPILAVPASLLAIASLPGDSVYAPSRHAEIYGGDYVAMVLYAEEQRITIAYTRRDSPAVGYVVHIEDFCVDPNLLALYRQLDVKGRGQLPAVHNAEPLGVAAGHHIKVAIRDSGQFMDPRSRKDWWQGH